MDFECVVASVDINCQCTAVVLLVGACNGVGGLEVFGSVSGFRVPVVKLVGARTGPKTRQIFDTQSRAQPPTQPRLRFLL